MDPVTAAIISAVTAGVAGAGPELVKKTVSDAYDGLKSLLKKKFGAGSDVVKAVNELEAKPDSEGRKNTLSEEVAAAKAHQDRDLLQAAQNLLESLKDSPGAVRNIQTATGSYIAQAQGNSKADITIEKSKD